MPQVPYDATPDVGPGQGTLPQVSVNTSLDAFGGGVAAAIRSAGNALEGAGDQIWARAKAMQQLEIESTVRDADAEYTIQLGELRAKYHASEGKTAVDAFPQYMQDVRDLQKKFSDSMPNPMARRMFDRESQNMASRTIFSGASHSATQNRRWAEGSSVARVNAAVNNTLGDSSPGALENGHRAIDQESKRLADINGWDEDQRQRYVRETNSRMMLTHLKGLAPTDPFKAQEFLEANKGNFDDRDIIAAQDIVRKNLYTVGSARIAREIVQLTPEGEEPSSRRDLIAEAERKAKALIPGDEEFATFVRDRVGAEITKRSAVIRDDVARNRNVVDTALMGGFGNGQLPTNPEELKASSPDAAMAWDRLSGTEQRKYMAVFARNAKGEVTWTNDNLSRYQTLKGMAQSNPEEFMSVDMVSETMPFSARRELITLQGKLRSRPESDPQVTRALQQLRPMLQSAGVSAQQDREGYWKFVGTLQDTLVQWQKDNPGKMPKAEDIQKIGSNLLQPQRETNTFSRVFGFWHSQTPTFNLTVPSELEEQFRSDPRWGGRSPSDAEVEMFRRQYIRKRYMELYGGRKEQ